MLLFMQRYSRFLTGLVAAPHTPMQPDGALHLEAVVAQAEGLIVNGVTGAFICGSTGESHSLTVAERQRVAEAWRQAIGKRPLKLIVHAGHNAIGDAQALAAHAADIGADAVSVMAPSYFKPGSVSSLVDFCAPVAAAAAQLPFYFYDIPSMTGVNLPMPEFLEEASKRIPNLAGLKYTSSNFMALQECLALQDGRFNLLFGSDEVLLAALVLGAHGAVGSTYNYAAPLYQRLLAAFEAGDLNAARALQLQSVKLVRILCEYGVLAAGKALMGAVGVECGPVRPPNLALSLEQIRVLRRRVQELGILSRPASTGPSGS